MLRHRGLDGELEYEEELEQIGPVDDRVRVRPARRNPSTRFFPFNTICYLEISRGGLYRPWGTGSLIAPRVVLTAGHVLHRAGIDPLRVTPGAAYDAARPRDRSAGRPANQVVPPSHYRIPAGFVEGTATDFGIVVLPRPFRSPARFMALQARVASRSSVPATIAGFPAEVRGVPQRGAMWRHSERIEVVASPDGLLRYPIDTSPANSGSPVWILGGGERRIQIGIHIAPRAFDPVGTRNVGTRITDRVLAQIALWCRTARVQLPTMWRSRS